MNNFKKIQSEITNHRNTLENEKLLDIEANKSRIDRDRLILEKSGVRELFEEIRDSGLVKIRLLSFYADGIWYIIKLFFGINYVPARIVANIPTQSSDYKGNVSISLEFNTNPIKITSQYCSVYSIDIEKNSVRSHIKFAVANGELCFVGYSYSPGDSYFNTYTPVGSRNIHEIITKELIKPTG